MPKTKVNEEDDESKKRRTRTMFTFEQQFKLEESFKSDHWPTTLKKHALASELGMSFQSVRTWFQNRRARQKREEELKKAKIILQKKWQNDNELSEQNQQPLKKPKNKGKASKGKKPGRCHIKTKSPAGSPKFSIMPLKQSLRLKAKRNLERKNRAETYSKPIKTSPASASSSSSGADLEASSMSGYDEKLISSQSQTVTSDSDEEGMNTNANNNSETGQKVSFARMKVTSGSGKTFQASSNGPNVPVAGLNVMMAGPAPPVPANVFKVLVEMMAVAEGGIVQVNDPENAMAINNTLYGVPIADQGRIVYDRMTGFSIVKKQ